MPSLSDIDLLAFLANGTVDRIISTFEGNTTTHNVGAATLSGGVYLPKTDNLRIANPFGKRGLMTMVWSVDGVNFYPQRPKIFQPGNPPLEGRPIATCGAMVSNDFIDFYFVHYSGVALDFEIFWVLDNII